MNGITGNLNLKDKLESFLDQSCEAEAAGNKHEAERLFRMALFCEGKLAPDVTDAREYVRQAGPIYQHTQSHGKQGNVGDKNETQTKN